MTDFDMMQSIMNKSNVMFSSEFERHWNNDFDAHGIIKKKIVVHDKNCGKEISTEFIFNVDGKLETSKSYIVGENEK